MIIALFLASVSLSSPQVDVVERALAGEAAAVQQLRAQGQAGLDALMERADAKNSAHVDVVARVAAQHDAIHSGLFWFTDLSEALTEAERTKRPVLSLRMLGKLDEALSCANSRFFRALLYADPAVARVMRERFVLHWQSVRPVPVVTVDMGDGRSFKTTLTGNSVHMVLDDHGKPLDAIPGMYSPPAFVAALEESLVVARCPTRACVARAHRDVLTKLDAEWARDMKKLGRRDPPVSTSAAVDARAVNIAERAMAKAVVEVPLLRQLDQGAGQPSPDVWPQLGRLRGGEIRWHQPALQRFSAGRSVERAVRLLDEIAADTAQNEQRHRRTIRAWFAQGEAATESQGALSNAIYDVVFATPSTDPWLGLGDVVDGAVVR